MSVATSLRKQRRERTAAKAPRRQPAVLALVVGLICLPGCIDEVRWRVKEPQAVSLYRRARSREMHPAQVILPEAGAPQTVPVPYRYWTGRHQRLPAAFCTDGPADGYKTLSRLTGLAFVCQGTALARRGRQGELELELSGETSHLLTAAGSVAVPLTTGGYDEQTTAVWARIGPLPGQPANNLDLLLVTPRANLVSATRAQHRQPLLGGVLIAFSGLYALAGGLALGFKATDPALPTIPVVAPAVLLLGTSIATLSTGIWLLRRPEKEIPLFP